MSTNAWIESDCTNTPATDRMGSPAPRSILSRRDVSCSTEVIVRRMFPNTLDCNKALASSA